MVPISFTSDIPRSLYFLFHVCLTASFMAHTCQGNRPHRRDRQHEGANTQPPVHSKLRHRRLMQRIDPPCHRTASSLKSLVRADQHRRDGGRIRHCPDQPVAERLPQGVVRAVEKVQEYRADGDICVHGVVDVLLESLSQALVFPFLEPLPSAPDHHGGDHEDDPAHPGALAAVKEAHVERLAHEEASEHLSQPVKGRVEGAGTDVEGSAVDVVLLVGVEDVGAEEEREDADDFEGEECFGDGSNFVEKGLMNDFFFGHFELRQPDAGWWVDEDSNRPPEKHDHHGGDVCAVRDGAGLGMKIQAEANQRADHTAKVEDNPEDRDSSPLLRFGDVGSHDRSLRDPEERGTDAENRTSSDDEAAIISNWKEIEVSKR
ncbi:hypothetical protein CIRG_10249 [Coccidioides immitis RMSCC 2394]|uniref:Uncharacterized protein n=1 Tax=Coccidioides immitis RMSCC 2394 TaxID=404692 RepID=A0A0J6Y1A8_COCIT|nr:hypothetical protein CIRG_10249 [Coccidioides immitis RMSCC 2394]